MIHWPKAQKRHVFMGDPFFYGGLCTCEETGDKTGIRIACYVRAPEPNPKLETCAIDWMLNRLHCRLTSNSKAKMAIRCLGCQRKEARDVWFMRLENAFGGPWCPICLDSKVREDLGLDIEVDEGIPLYLVHINHKFLTELQSTTLDRAKPIEIEVEPRVLF